MDKYYNTFIIKISDGSTTSSEGMYSTWRRRKKRYFNGLAEMNHFIAEHLGPRQTALLPIATPNNNPTGCYPDALTDFQQERG
jgi:hypothetical protein